MNHRGGVWMARDEEDVHLAVVVEVGWHEAYRAPLLRREYLY